MDCVTKIKQVNSNYKSLVSLEEQIDFLMEDKMIQKGAGLLKKGEVVAFPTETVYGLGADARNEEAVGKIFKAKGRPADNPLIVHIAERKQLSSIISGSVSSDLRKLMDTFWPGPLTLIFPRGNNVSDKITAGLDTVAVRMPAHPSALALITVSGLPVAAPSANSSGFPSPTRAEHVLEDLGGLIPLIIDDGDCNVGVESTVLDLTTDKPVVLRPGGVPREKIGNILGYDVDLKEKNSNDTPASPGMKYRHYAPVTPVYLFEKDNFGSLNKFINENSDKRVALIVAEETKEKIKKLPVEELCVLAPENDFKKAAHRLFYLLRELDKGDFDFIIVEEVSSTGLGEAIMNRLHKAAGNNIYLN